MTGLRDQVLHLLDEHRGDVTRVVESLPVSAAYVYRLKTNEWQSDLPVVPAQQLTSNDLLKRVIPPNIAQVTELRDLTLTQLIDRVKEGDLPVKELLAILRVLTTYETRLHDTLSPATNILDNRTSVQVVNLVDQLGNLPVEKLRALGWSEDATIEG